MESLEIFCEKKKKNGYEKFHTIIIILSAVIVPPPQTDPIHSAPPLWSRCPRSVTPLGGRLLSLLCRIAEDSLRSITSIFSNGFRRLVNKYEKLSCHCGTSCKIRGLTDQHCGHGSINRLMSKNPLSLTQFLH